MSNAVFSGGGNAGGFDMGFWSPGSLIGFILSVFSSSHSSTQVTYTSGSTTLILHGSFSSFDANGDPSAGTLTSFDYTTQFTPGNPVSATFSGFSVGVSQLRTWINANDTTALDNAVLGGADIMTGTAFADKIVGYGGNDAISGGDGNDAINGGAGDDALTGGSENDVFLFVAGQANGDAITDFDGGGAGAGDALRFAGYGTLAGGATFVQLDATHWQINSADGLIHDTIVLANGASIDASDWLFV